jgi:hypothetical protein
MVVQTPAGQYFQTSPQKHISNATKYTKNSVLPGYNYFLSCTYITKDITCNPSENEEPKVLAVVLG